MNLKINGEAVEYQLEKEESLAELIMGISTWLEKEEHVLTGIEVDGKKIAVEALEKTGNIAISDIKNVNISALHWLNIYREALETLLQIFSLSEKAQEWQNNPAESFLLIRDRHLHGEVAQAISSNDESLIANAKALTYKRLALLEDPHKYLATLIDNFNHIIPRLEDLPIALQTGNDREASLSISAFVETSEALLHAIPIFRSLGLLVDDLEIEDQSFPIWLEDLRDVLNELAEGYKNADIIAVGDLSEYELAPRLAALLPALALLLEKEKT